MEQQIEGRVKKLVREEQKELEEQTGGFSDEIGEDETQRIHGVSDRGNKGPNQLL